MLKLNYLLLMIVLQTIAFSVHAQPETYNWTFGNNAGLKFDGSPNQPSPFNSIINGHEGCATISDDNGQLLFYTDGDRIFGVNNGTHQVVQSNLLGNPSSTQSSLIVPDPTSSDQYYIFGTQALNATGSALSYAVYNPSSNSYAVNPNIIEPGVTEKIAAVRKANGTGYWIVTHDWGNKDFLVYELDCNGLNTTPAVYTAGAPHTGNSNVHPAKQGYLNFNADGDKLAIACMGGNNDQTGQGGNNYGFVQIFDFDANTGAVSGTNIISIGLNTNTQTDDNSTLLSPYGVEFSPNSQYLYISEFPTGKIWQYQLSTSNMNLAMHDEHGVGALKMGPNGRLYAAVKEVSYLAVISSPNNLISNPIPVTGNAKQSLSGTSRFGLPNMIGGLVDTPISIIVDQDPCSSDVTFTAPTGFDSYVWDFDDNTSAVTTANNTITHSFPGAGTYNVNLIGQIGNCSKEQTVQVTISTPSIVVKGTTTACYGTGQTGGIKVIGANPGSTCTWYSTNGGLYSISADGQTIYATFYQPAGTYTYCCDLYDPMCGTTTTHCIDVTVLPAPTFPVLSDGDIICSNAAPIILPGGNTGECWLAYQGPGISPVGQSFPPSSYQFDPSQANIGPNELSVSCGGCETTITVNVVDAGGPELPSSICETNQSICWPVNTADDLLQGPGVSAGTIGGTQCFDPSGLSGTVTLTSQSGTVQCPLSIDIFVYEAPVISGVVDGQVFCTSDACVQLSVANNTDCPPSLNASPDNSILVGSAQTGYQLCPSNVAPGTYQISIKCGGCEPQYITITVLQSPKPVAVPKYLCYTGEPFCWTSIPGVYANGPGVTTIIPPNPVDAWQHCFDPMAAGVGFHTIQMVGPNGCASTPSTIQVLAGPNVNAGPDVIVCVEDLCNSGTYIGMPNAPTGPTYEWDVSLNPMAGSLLGNLDDPYQEISHCNPVWIPTWQTEPCFVFTLKATGKFGCTNTDDVTVCIENTEILNLNLSVSQGSGNCDGVATINNLPAGVTSVLLNGPTPVNLVNGNQVTGLCPGNHIIEIQVGCKTYKGELEIYPVGLQRNVSMELAPNPASSRVAVTFNQAIENGTLEIQSMAGVTLEQIQVMNTDQLNINLSQYESGTYLIVLTSSEGETSERLIIRN